MKTVLCVFGVRRKKVSFETKNASGSDYTNLKEAVLHAVNSDSELTKKLQNSHIVLQMKDPDFGDLGPIDLEPDAIIPHGSVIYVEFEPVPSNTDNLCIVDENGKDIIVNKVCVESSSTGVIAGFNVSKACTNASAQDAQATSGDESEADVPDNLTISSEDEGLENPSEGTNRDTPLRKTTIVYPSELPSLEGTHIENYTTDEDVLIHLSEFIRMWTSDLSKRTNACPLPSDYKNYALNVLDKYPFLGQGMSEKVQGRTKLSSHRNIAKKMSVCLRNRKYWPKRKEEKRKPTNKNPDQQAEVSNGASDSNDSVTTQREAEPAVPGKRKLALPSTSCPLKKAKKVPASKKPKSADRPSSFHPKTNEYVCSDDQHEDFLKEMIKTKNDSHKQLLMDATRAKRRKFITQAENLTEMVEKYQELKKTEMMLYEFNHIVPSAVEVIERTLPQLLAKLASYFHLPCESPAEEFALISQLQEALMPNKTDGNQKAITVNKIFENTNALNTKATDSLKLEVFLDVDVVKCAFVVGERQRWEVPKPATTCRCLATLLGAYHVFDRQYPFAYKNVMTFFYVNVLELAPPEDKLHAKYVKFVQLLNLKKR